MAICVILAVISGAFLANMLSEKMTTYIAGVLFIVFAFESLLMID
jgi:putative Ca2+/H+ antiporter (TMEM165/GDT1 family)